MACHLQRGFCLARFERPFQSRTQVITRGCKTMKPFDLIWSANFFSRLFCKTKEIGQMLIARACFLSHPLQINVCKMLNYSQHVKANLAVCFMVRQSLEKTFVQKYSNETRYGCVPKHFRKNGLHRLKRKSPGKDRKIGK